MIQQLDWEIKMSHVYREADFVPMVFAMMGISAENKLTIYDDCPDQIRRYFDVDAAGVLTPRLVKLLFVLLFAFWPFCIPKKNSVNSGDQGGNNPNIGKNRMNS